MIDHTAQKTESVTGIASIHGQDQAVTGGMGPITDHDFENLGPSDIMIARTRRSKRAPRAFAKDGGLVLGVCNGFQILCEAGLLPGVLMRNARLKFVCKDVHLRVERSDTPFTRGYNAGQVIRVPVAHGEGNYEADEETLKRLEGEGRVLYRYCSADGVVDDAANFNGAAHSIAGVVNERGNVLGMMPHPENHVEDIMGCTDGRGLFAGLAAHLDRAA